MCSLTCVSVVVCVARKLCLCPSYSTPPPPLVVPHPLWQDILLTFAEMELDSTTMFPLGQV